MDKMPLAGLTEIAMRAGVTKSAVCMWRVRDIGFPDPVAELHAGSVWWWPQVETWLRQTGRRTDAGWTAAQVTPLNRDRLPGRRRNG